MNEIHLHKTKHPDSTAQTRYDYLIGLDTHKDELTEYLLRVFDPGRVSRWLSRHHRSGLALAQRIEQRPPLVILGGEVGCGKTALATSIGTPIAKIIDKQIVALETPSDIRGGGLVGQLSERVTAAFQEARAEVGQHCGILLIDEADDLGSSRAQMQAHHEDRAGLNVLIKEIDRLARDRTRIAVILITNRVRALDPALVRRAQTIHFARPDADARRALFAQLLCDVPHDKKDLTSLVHVSDRKPLFSYSDLVERGAEATLMRCVRENKPFSVAALCATLDTLEPSPETDDLKP